MCTVSARQPACKLVVDEAVHQIRRHCTPSDRVHRYVTGVAPLVRSRCEHVEAVWLRPMLPVGACVEELPAVGLVVGGGAPDL